MEKSIETLNTKSLQDILRTIKECDDSGDGYTVDKNRIRKVCSLPESRHIEDVIARLAWIDGMYSTRMSRRY